MNELETFLGTESREITGHPSDGENKKDKIGESNEREKPGCGICLNFPA